MVVNLDYAAGELRVTAVVAEETNMLTAFKQGMDPHLYTGCSLAGLTYEKGYQMKKNPTSEAEAKLIKKLRQGAKAASVGLLYGMQVAGYVAYARDNYGVSMTMQEGEENRNKFLHQMYPGLPAWHEDSINYAREHQFIASPLGRIRHLPLINSKMWGERSRAERQAINSPIQSCLSDMSVWSLVEFHKRYGQPEGCQFFAMCHDALTAYVKEDELDIWLPRVRDIMRDLPLYDVFGWESPIVFEADAEIGPNMGDLIEMSFKPNGSVDWEDYEHELKKAA